MCSERKSSNVKQETVWKTSLMMKKVANFDEYIIIIETRIKILTWPSTDDVHENTVMDTNEWWYLPLPQSVGRMVL